MGLLGRATQQVDGPGITHGGVRDSVFFEFDGLFWFCHTQEYRAFYITQFNREWTQINPDKNKRFDANFANLRELFREQKLFALAREDVAPYTRHAVYSRN